MDIELAETYRNHHRVCARGAFAPNFEQFGTCDFAT